MPIRQKKKLNEYVKVFFITITVRFYSKKEEGEDPFIFFQHAKQIAVKLVMACMKNVWGFFQGEYQDNAYLLKYLTAIIPHLINDLTLELAHIQNVLKR